MKNSQKVLIGIGVVLVALIVVVALQPADFTVSRSATIAAPADVVFPLVNDFHNWAAWSPWDKSDPNLKRTITGPAAGPGAVYAWEGDRVGTGKMTIIDSRPNELVNIKVDFIKPFPASDNVLFTFAPGEKEETTVTWKMSGHKDLMGKAAGMVVNFDKAIGSDFEKGLASLKQLAENEAKKRAGEKPEAMRAF